MASRRLGGWAAVAFGGAIGTVARYEATLSAPVRSGQFPWTILVVNLVGCVLAGAVMAIVHRWSACPSWVRPFAVIGVCGGLTTFSSWMVADVLLVRADAGGAAALDVGVSLVTGVVAVWLGFVVARAVVGDRGAIGTLDPTEVD